MTMPTSCEQLINAASVTGEPDGVLALSYDARTRSRGRAVSDSGEDVAWFLDRGVFLRDGDCLIDESGRRFLINAAPEPVSRVSSEDKHLLTRAAYHLGNRHVSLQIDDGGLSYQPDHVLDEMVRSLGLKVLSLELPFQPEDGAYHGGHHHG